MMTEPLLWSPINLGRWAGIQVRIHFSLIFYVAFSLLGAAISKDHHLAAAAAWVVLMLLALAIHEVGHATLAWWLGAEPEDVRLWPLGNMVGPSSSRSADNWVVTLGGEIASLAVVIITAVWLHAIGGQFVWYPFGNAAASGKGPGALDADALHGFAPAFTMAWWVGWFGYINWVIFLANLLPALPFDNGRALRAYLANASVSTAKDHMIAPWLARGVALILIVVGLFQLLVSRNAYGFNVILLAVLIEMMFRAEARMYEDGGFFDDGVFGYDFSEGYTSLEGSAAKVRPYRESALKRWRRRRSDLRRQRRQAKEAAEERRMDEILAKLHTEGRSALTDEEHRFLLRVSAKYRNKPRARD